MGQFYGKHRGKVVNNIDPEGLVRIVPLVPAVSELPLTWALPAAPFAGPGVGLFTLPPLGANVWIEFERGDPNYPIWSGCFWGEGQVPADPPLPTTVALQTNLVTLTIDDLQAALKLEVKTPAGLRTVEMTPEGIKISNNIVTLTLTDQAIELKHTASTATVTPEGVALKSGAAAVEVTPGAVSLKNGAASAELSPAAISLKNGASSIDLSPASVSVNNGALEVI